MQKRWPGEESPDDATLLQRVRDGDALAYGVLYQRYRERALAHARRLGPPQDAEDVVADAFASVLRVIQGGRGPTSNFLGYLMTTVRNDVIAGYRYRARNTITDDDRMFDSADEERDSATTAFERAAVLDAIRLLPDTQRDVLWAMEVEGRPPREIAEMWAMTPNAVSALALRARAALREAYLAQHVRSLDSVSVARDCRVARDRLAAFVRGTLTARRARLVTEHLDECLSCESVRLELVEADQQVAAVIGPVLVAATAGSLVWSKVLAAKAALLSGGGVASVMVGGAAVLTATVPAVILSVPHRPPSAEMSDAPAHVASFAVGTPPARNAGEDSQKDQTIPAPAPARSGDTPVASGPPASRPHQVGQAYGDPARGYVITDVSDEGTTTDYSEPDPVVQEMSRLASSPKDSNVTWYKETLETVRDSYVVTAERQQTAQEQTAHTVCGIAFADLRIDHFATITRTLIRYGYRTLPDGSRVEVVDRIVLEPITEAWSTWAGQPPMQCPETTPEEERPDADSDVDPVGEPKERMSSTESTPPAVGVGEDVADPASDSGVQGE